MGPEYLPGNFRNSGICNGKVGKSRILAQILLIKPGQDVGIGRYDPKSVNSSPARCRLGLGL